MFIEKNNVFFKEEEQTEVYRQTKFARKPEVYRQTKFVEEEEEEETKHSFFSKTNRVCRIESNRLESIQKFLFSKKILRKLCLFSKKNFIL